MFNEERPPCELLDLFDKTDDKQFRNANPPKKKKKSAACVAILAVPQCRGMTVSATFNQHACKYSVVDEVSCDLCCVRCWWVFQWTLQDGAAPVECLDCRPIRRNKRFGSHCVLADGAFSEMDDLSGMSQSRSKCVLLCSVVTQNLNCSFPLWCRGF